MRYISKPQLLSALKQLATFRERAPKQAVKHVLGFLALRWGGVGTDKMTRFEERQDFEFFDQFMKVAEGDYPYFDPIAGMMRAPGHPHSNVATARKGTFYRTWHAAVSDVDANGAEEWKLEPDYLSILQKKALTKGGAAVKVPAFSLGAFLLRNTGFPDNDSWENLGRELQSRFHLSPEEYRSLFEEQTKPEGESSPTPLTKEQVMEAIQESGILTEAREARSTFQDLTIPADNPILLMVRQLLADGYAGVVFVGPPGTSKSWYAVQVALALADGNVTRVRKVQFHRSFQYEQFVEGFVPNEDGTGFELKPQLMRRLIQDAEDDRGSTFVVLIDELSRSDPGRVFGELLTYMEPSRRDETFILSSGEETSIPPNIVFVATMNSRDKNVVDIDDAFDRRLGKIKFPPDPAILDKFLQDNGATDEFRRRVGGFFKWLMPKYPLGHTFFKSVKDEESLKRLWNTQLQFVFEKQFKYEPAALTEIRNQFVTITGVTPD